MTRARLWLGVGVVALLATAGIGGALALRASQRADFVRASLPAAPAADPRTPRLTARFTEAFARARAGEIAGLAEVASLLHANGAYAEARGCYAALRAIEPKEARWAHRLASLHAVFGELSAAIPLWQETIALAPDYLPARVRLGEAWLKTDQLDAAVAEFQAVLARSPNDDYAAHGLARIDFARGRWQEARARLEPLVARSPFGLGTDLLASAYENLGDSARAAEALGRTRAHGTYVGLPDPWMEELNEDCYDPFRLALESGAAELRGDDDRAARWLNRAIELAPADGGLRLAAGTFYEKRKRLDLARQHFEKGVAAAPQFSDLWVRLVVVLEAQGDKAAAARALSEGLARNPESGALLLERGRRFQAAGQMDRAEADLRRAIAVRHDDANPCVELANMLFVQERVAEGRAMLEQALVAEPDHPAALATLAFVAITQGDRAAADRWWALVQQQPRVENRARDRLVSAYRQAFGAAPPR